MCRFIAPISAYVLVSWGSAALGARLVARSWKNVADGASAPSTGTNRGRAASTGGGTDTVHWWVPGSGVVNWALRGLHLRRSGCRRRA